MADCVPFQLFVGADVEAIVELLRVELVRARGSCRVGSGDFAIPTPIGTISGCYAIEGKALTVHIRSRPSSVSCGTIESKMQDYILDAKAAFRNSTRKKQA